MPETTGAKVKTEMDAIEAEIRAAREAQRAIEEERGDAGRAATAKIHAGFAERMEEAGGRLARAERAKRDAIEASASHPWEGKRVYRIQKVGRRLSLHPAQEERLDGILEVRRQATTLPANLGWTAPKIGDPFIRKLKKDGTPGLAIYTRERIDQWKLAE